MNSKRYTPRQTTARPTRPGFIYTGSRRDCPECFAYNGHFTICDKVQ